MSSRTLRRLGGAAALLLCCAALAGCARPIGDLGRAQQGVLHDEIMPAIGKAGAGHKGIPVSSFNLTDQEVEMHDRVWRFLISPHAADWFMDTAVELRRTRLASTAKPFDTDRYYSWLQQRRYSSSRVRYATVADHVQADLDTAPGVFEAICRVIEIDRQRGMASRELGGLSAADVHAREDENRVHIAWFTSALRYRYDSYGYALDHLLVETPHEEATEVDARLSELIGYVQRAEAGDFCGSGGAVRWDRQQRAIPSRLQLPRPSEGEFRK